MAVDASPLARLAGSFKLGGCGAAGTAQTLSSAERTGSQEAYRQAGLCLREDVAAKTASASAISGRDKDKILLLG